MKMKKSKLLLLMAIGVATTPLAWGGAGLSGTAHDFTAGTGGHLPFDPATSAGVDVDGLPLGDVGLCTYCHTPHKAQSTHLLWNHTLSSNTFSWTDPTTTAGTTLPTISGASYQGATAKCLSCHDGSVAIGDVAWFYAQKQTLDATKMGAMTGPSPVDAGANFIIADTATGSMNGNHPVAIAYPFGGASNTYNGTTDAGVDTTEFQADPQLGGIRLFTDDGAGVITAGATAGQTGIECSSCHDPHNKHTLDDLFLRGTLTGGTGSDYICLKCHIK